MHADLVESAPIVRDVVIRVMQRPLESLELQSTQLIERCALDRVKVLRPGGALLHGGSPSGSAGTQPVLSPRPVQRRTVRSGTRASTSGRSSRVPDLTVLRW